MRYGFQLCHEYGKYSVPFPAVAELKVDGQLAMLEDGRLYSRQLNDITDRFPEIEKTVNAVIVGEIAVFTKEHPGGDFNLILFRKAERDIAMRARTAPATFMVFDILEVNGRDVSSLPFRERRDLLETYMTSWSPKGWELMEQIEVNSDVEIQHLLEKAYDMNIEGFVIKRLDARHVPKRTANFLKLKTFKEEDFDIVGFEDTVGVKGNAGFVITIKSGGELQKVNVGAVRDQDLIRSRKVTRVEIRYLRKSAAGALYLPTLSKLKEDF